MTQWPQQSCNCICVLATHTLTLEQSAFSQPTALREHKDFKAGLPQPRAQGKSMEKLICPISKDLKSSEKPTHPDVQSALFSVLDNYALGII